MATAIYNPQDRFRVANWRGIFLAGKQLKKGDEVSKEVVPEMGLRGLLRAGLIEPIPATAQRVDEEYMPDPHDDEDEEREEDTGDVQSDVPRKRSKPPKKKR